ERINGSPSGKVEGHGDRDAPEHTDTIGSKEKKVTKALSFYKMETEELLDFNFEDIPQLDGEELPSFVYKIRKSSRKKKRAMEILNLFYQDIGTSSSSGRHLTQEDAAKEALSRRINQGFALLEEVRLVLETMAYIDKYKKMLDEIWMEKVELDRMIAEEDEKAIIKVKGEVLKEEDDLGAFI
nr:hypothetical protein [Tanacetum cinerariifolium]